MLYEQNGYSNNCILEQRIIIYGHTVLAPSDPVSLRARALNLSYVVFYTSQTHAWHRSSFVVFSSTLKNV